MSEGRARGWQVARVVIGGANIFFAGVLILISLAFLTADMTLGATAMPLVVIAGATLQLLSGVGVMTSSRGGDRMTAIACLFQGLSAAGLAFSLSTSAAFGISWVSLLSALALHHSLLRHPEAKALPFGLHGGHAALLAGGLMAIYFASEEVVAVRQDLMVSEFETACESGDLDACRAAARTSLEASTTFEEAAAAGERIDELCERGHLASCRLAAYARSDTFFPNISEVFDESEWARAAAGCAKGESRSCGVWAWSDGYTDAEELTKVVTRLCGEGDGIACHAWAVSALRGIKVGGSNLAAARAASCAAGFTAHCDPEPEAAVRERCLDGELAACASAAAGPDEAPLLAALAAVSQEGRNPGLYDVKLPDHDYASDCTSNGGIACLAAGLLLVGPGAATAAPPLPSKASLDATLGRACDDGINVACLVYGFRLIDRPVDEERDLASANARLGQACGRGNLRACWLRNYDAELLERQYGGQRDSAKHACMSGSTAGCQLFYALLSAEAAAVPWPVADIVAFPLLRDGCRKQHRLSCAHMAWLVTARTEDVLESAVPELRISAFDAATRSCRAASQDGCREVLKVARRWWPGAEAGLREPICKQMPAACTD